MSATPNSPSSVHSGKRSSATSSVSSLSLSPPQHHFLMEFPPLFSSMALFDSGSSYVRSILSLLFFDCSATTSFTVSSRQHHHLHVDLLRPCLHQHLSSCLGTLELDGNPLHAQSMFDFDSSSLCFDRGTSPSSLMLPPLPLFSFFSFYFVFLFFSFYYFV